MRMFLAKAPRRKVRKIYFFYPLRLCAFARVIPSSVAAQPLCASVVIFCSVAACRLWNLRGADYSITVATNRGVLFQLFLQPAGIDPAVAVLRIGDHVFEKRNQRVDAGDVKIVQRTQSFISGAAA